MSTKNYLTIDLSNITEQDAVDQPIVRIEAIEREVKEGAEAKFVPESPEMAAANREGQMQSLFNAAMREIHELATGALGYDQICEPIQAVRRLAQKFGSMKAELKEACAKIEHQRNWYGCRSQRLQQFAKEEMSEAQQERFFSIMANGTADANEPPTYAQQYNMLKERAEQAEARLAEVIGIKDEIVEDREREYQRWREAEARAEAARSATIEECGKVADEQERERRDSAATARRNGYLETAGQYAASAAQAKEIGIRIRALAALSPAEDEKGVKG